MQLNLNVSFYFKDESLNKEICRNMFYLFGEQLFGPRLATAVRSCATKELVTGIESP
jgi:hypothetical protein